MSTNRFVEPSGGGTEKKSQLQWLITIELDRGVGDPEHAGVVKLVETRRYEAGSSVQGRINELAAAMLRKSERKGDLKT